MNRESPVSDGAAEGVISVSQLNRAVAGMLERAVPPVSVRGEVSNFLCAASGHWYFTLKDAGASVRAVMFRMRAAQAGFLPRAGDSVEVRAQVTLYEPRGEYQLQVQAMRRAGQGDLFEAFLRLKQRLADEGLLDAARKRTPVNAPRAVGVVTSLHAAALRDVLSALARRLPHVQVIVYPSPVQGPEAAPRIVRALQSANARGEVDVLLLVRGGGSIEDLWSFNDERLARAVAGSRIPVICGVGHESDFTIADLVADVRAPTPTAAAELAGAPHAELAAAVGNRVQALMRAQRRRLERLAQRVDRAAVRLVSPAQRLERGARRLEALTLALQHSQRGRLDALVQRIDRASVRLTSPAQRVDWAGQRLAQLAASAAQLQTWRLERLRQRVGAAQAHLQALGPEQTLARGYAIVRDLDGHVVRKADELSMGQALDLQLAQGSVKARVDDVKADEPQATERSAGL